MDPVMGVNVQATKAATSFNTGAADRVTIAGGGKTVRVYENEQGDLIVTDVHGTFQTHFNLSKWEDVSSA